MRGFTDCSPRPKKKIDSGVCNPLLLLQKQLNNMNVFGGACQNGLFLFFFDHTDFRRRK